jgi:hypothetical protein
MKRILLLGYIFSVLLISGFARAEEKSQRLMIKDVQYTEGSWNIQVSGPLPNLCVTSPQPTLVADAKRPNLMILQMVGKSTAELCGQAVRGNYSEPVDLRGLMAKSGFRLRPGVTYTIKADGHPFEVSFEGPLSIDSTGGDVVEVSGLLMKTPQGQLAILTNDQYLVLVDGSLFDCRPFLNTYVSVVGHFGPLQTAGNRMMLPSLDQQPRPTNRLMVVNMTSADR